MKSRNMANILGAQVDIVNNQVSLERIKHFIAQKQAAHVITLNAEIVYQARQNQDLLNIINGADLVTPDGIGIVWAGNYLGYSFEERVSGIDLLYILCSQALLEDWKIYLLGAAPGIAEEAARQLGIKYPGIKICGCHNGYFSADQQEVILEEIRNCRPDILFVALGAPGQEFWIQKYKKTLGVPVSIGVGGSFDVIAGLKTRAPGWVIRANLEWLYRLFKEPSRFKRQLALPKFVLLVLKQRFKKK
jgi:N-acetylglucosaminyldiphosphoundecaprenol N-acetyl-beta-D-mannosaminyltransferase